MSETTRTNKVINGISVQTSITIVMGVLEISLFAIMSRLLTKTDFGYYAALMGIMNVCMSLSEAGLGSAIIQKKDASQDHVNTAFSLSVILGAFFTVFVFVAAPYLALLVADNHLTWPLRILSITLLLNSLNSIGGSLLLKKLNFKRAGIISIISYATSGLAAIVMALNGFGLYSIVTYVVLYPLLVCILFYTTSIKIPKFSIVRNEVQDIVSFGGWLTAGVIVNNLTHQLDKLLLSKWLSVEALGSYNRPAGFVSNIASKINGIFDTVLFPILSDMQKDKTKIEQVFYRSVSLLNSFSVLLSAIFFFNAELIITVFFGQQWLELVPILRIVSISVIFNVNGRLVDCFFRSLALVKTGCILRFISAFITLACLYVGVRFEIFGVALGLVTANILTIITKVIVLAIKIKSNLYLLLKAWVRALVPVFPIAIAGVFFIILCPKTIVSEIVFATVFSIIALTELVFFPSFIGAEYSVTVHPTIMQITSKIFTFKVKQ